eukprot:scaffold22272_cov85-Skeletonema_marinoi.AAC.1
MLWHVGTLSSVSFGLIYIGPHRCSACAQLTRSRRASPFATATPHTEELIHKKAVLYQSGAANQCLRPRTFILHDRRHLVHNFIMAAPAPVALHQENVPDDLICSICMTVPSEPLITPCDHLFCRTCIHQALSDRNICPIDRRPCTVGQLRQLDGILSRIWSGIQVKCGGHESGCAWRGSIADYSSHVQNNCSASSGNNNNSSAVREE